MYLLNKYKEIILGFDCYCSILTLFIWLKFFISSFLIEVKKFLCVSIFRWFIKFICLFFTKDVFICSLFFVMLWWVFYII